MTYDKAIEICRSPDVLEVWLTPTSMAELTAEILERDGMWIASEDPSPGGGGLVTHLKVNERQIPVRVLDPIEEDVVLKWS